MAEAAVQEQPLNKCYCHQCRKEITPKLPDFICPTCSGGFIEDLSEVLGNAVDDGSANPIVRNDLLYNGHFMEHFGQDTHSNSSSSTSNDGEDPERNAGSGISFQLVTPGNTISVGRIGGGRGGRGASIGGGGAENVAVNPLQSLLEPILLGLTGHGRGGTIVFGGPGLGGGIHGSLGDYAWGEGGLDSIITQLMNQLEGTGPPPASEEKITSLPTIKIGEHHVSQHSQCNICFEDYTLHEEVVQLPCEHLYHRDCVTPWLRQHGTCPVCRKNLNGKDTSCDQNNQSIPDVLTNFGISRDENSGGSAVRPTFGGSGNIGIRTDQTLANSEASRVDPSGNMDDVSLDGDDTDGD